MRAGLTRLAAIVLLVLCSAATLGSQAGVRRLTTIDAVQAFPGYYHLQNVILRGEFVEQGTAIVFRSDDQDIPLVNPSQSRGGAVEVRGQIIDVGRLEPGDGRLLGYGDRRDARDWPRPGAEVVLSISGVREAELAASPSVRAVSLEPWKFEGQRVTLAGTFRGRNLFGDLPDAPGASRYDFVLSGAEGAVWVTGLRPRGRGFDLDVARRMDTGRWLEVTGVVHRNRGLVTIAGATVSLTTPPAVVAEEPEEEQAPVPLTPTEVVFSSPVDNEVDVDPGTVIRVQFSRGLREPSLEGQVRVSYLGAPPNETPAEFTTTYDGATRSIRIRFSRPLEPFRTVRVELLPDITAFDGAPFVPWTMTFSVGR